MELTIKQATILSRKSPFHGQKMDIYLKDGKIREIQKNIPVSSKSKVIEGKSLYCTTGLVDIGTHSGEPGMEHRETMDSLATSARAGGYTALITVPNTIPYSQTKSDLQFLIQKGKEAHIQIFPLGALSIDGQGNEIAEYYDMFMAGAVGFSDGLRSCQDSGLLQRACQYVKAFNGIIVHHPEDKTLRGKGLMHEGQVSTSLGLKGVPAIAEVAMVQRDLLIREYTDSKLLIHAISSKESTKLLQDAKKSKSSVFSSVAYLNLIATDQNLAGFDVMYKVRPVLREEADKNALVKAVKDDIIDAIISNHVPVDEDGKKVEFPYADQGAGGLETAFMATMDALSSKIEMENLVSKFNESPRKIFGIPEPLIQPGENADLCIFETGISYPFQKTLSLSTNNPLINRTFNTRVRASVLGDHFFGE
jgi:dihydroorotase